VLLAPGDARVPSDFDFVDLDPYQHGRLLAGMQRLRGMVYLQDGAVGRRELSYDGRLRLTVDDQSWHLLTLDEEGSVCGCVRYLAHPNTIGFQDLWVSNSALADSSRWGWYFRSAVEEELRRARLRNLAYVEVGGWAISPERRCSAEALRTVLATYSLAEVLGGCLGITTATVRHHSSSILRRLGGSSLKHAAGEIPAYYDPQYRCEMEVLRFDSTRPAARFGSMLEELRAEILSVPVICRNRRRSVWSSWVPAQEPTVDWPQALQQRPAC